MNHLWIKKFGEVDSFHELKILGVKKFVQKTLRMDQLLKWLKGINKGVTKRLLLRKFTNYLVVEPTHLKKKARQNGEDIFPKDRGENKKCLSCHHLGNQR